MYNKRKKGINSTYLILYYLSLYCRYLYPFMYIQVHYTYVCEKLTRAYGTIKFK